MWEPILTGSLRTEALTAVDEIANILARLYRRSANSSRRTLAGRLYERERVDPSLASGAAGLAIFFSYLSQVESGSGQTETALSFLRQAVQTLSQQPIDESLFGGYTGVAWAVAHLRSLLLDPTDDSTRWIDKLMKQHLNVRPWDGHYDLISGLVGFGVYAMEQLPRPFAVDCLRKVIDRLDEMGRRSSLGICWLTTPNLLPNWQRKIHPKGHCDLGLAHGVAGIIAFLAEVLPLKPSSARMPAQTQRTARLLLENAVRWLLAHKMKYNSARSFFPSWTGGGLRSRSSRVGWCYGDLGIAAALMKAASSTGKSEWHEEALRIARHVARRPARDFRVRDCGLCHGAAGVAHLFNRMFQSTADNRLKEAAQTWFRRLLKMRRTSEGVAGFFALHPGADGEAELASERGLLEGAAGVGLALLAGATAVEPEWDRMMLVSIGPKLES